VSTSSLRGRDDADTAHTGVAETVRLSIVALIPPREYGTARQEPNGSKRSSTASRYRVMSGFCRPAKLGSCPSPLGVIRRLG
jgi:hypothetical protein